MAYKWPGNVRELEGAIKDIVVIGIDKLAKLEELRREAALLSGEAQFMQTLGISGGGNLRDMQRDAIISALIRNNGNRTHTANELGVTVRTVRNHLKKLRGEMEMKLELKPYVDSSQNGTK